MEKRKTATFWCVMKVRTAGFVILGLSATNSFAQDQDKLDDIIEGRMVDALPRIATRALPDSMTFPATRDSRTIALYNGDGAWGMGVDHTKMLLQSLNLSYETITAENILKGELTTARYSLLIMPGGKSWIYLKDLGEPGAKAIRDFVDAGGGYFGTCAGAYTALSHREGGSVGGGAYGIGLLQGWTFDGTTIGVKPFKSGEMQIDYNLKDFKKDYTVLMLGGPAFIYTTAEAVAKNVQVIARFERTTNAHVSAIDIGAGTGIGPAAPGGKHADLPAVITFHYGLGHVALSGPHGEIEENQTYIRALWEDPDSEWPILEKLIDFARNGTTLGLRE